MTAWVPKTAMVLAAGEGRRMRPLTDTLPKPLLPVKGVTLIDRVLNRLSAAGVERAVVNLHYLGDRLRRHLAGRERPQILFSEEERLLETGGGIVKALPLLGEEPFFVVNGDILWLNGTEPGLQRLAQQWDDRRMDALLLVHPTVLAHGYDGRGDFQMDQVGRLSLRGERLQVPFAYTGMQLLSPRLFAGRKAEPFPLIQLYRAAAERGRLYGERHQGEWFHVGTPDGLAEAEAELSALGFHDGEG